MNKAGVLGVVLVGFGMFLAYLYSQGKLQKIYKDAFGPIATAKKTTTATNATSTAPTSSSAPVTTIPQVESVSGGVVGIPAATPFTSSASYFAASLSYPQVSATA